MDMKANQQVMAKGVLNFGKAQRKVLNKTPHIVVPVTLLVEGVHNGSLGPLFYPAEELKEIPQAWNGRVITLRHPVDEKGNPTMAGSPFVHDTQVLGQLFNTSWNEGRKALESWAWFNEILTRAVSPVVLNAVAGGKDMEGSTGLFFDLEASPGKWGEEEYIGIVRNIVPDHMAALPDEEGACSKKDGCGFGVVNESTLDVTKLDGMEGGYKVSFAINVNGDANVELPHLRESILRALNIAPYSAEGGDAQGATNTDQSGQREEDSSMKKACPKKVDAFIANEATPFGEDQRAFLADLSEEAFDKLAAGFVENTDNKGDGNGDAPKTTVTPTTNTATTPTKTEDKKVQFMDLFNSAPPEVQDMMTIGGELFKKQLAANIKTILESEGNEWTEDELKSMGFNSVEKIAKPLRKKAETVSDPAHFFFGGAAGGDASPVTNAPKAPEKPLGLPVHNYGKKGGNA